MTASLEQLTRRELDVAVLVRDGLTDREVAEKLFISRRTAEWHVEQILNKLGLRSRSQIAAAVAHAELPALPKLFQPDSGTARWPPQPAVLLGRQSEMAELRELLLRPAIRLLTLTGPPGTGKTSLGARIALDVASEFRDGAFFVDLSPINDPPLVLPAIAQVVGTAPRSQELIPSLKRKGLLLMLDNFEQVLPAADQVADLLAACAGLKVLVTSRESLHLLRWEHEYSVGPLRLPDTYQLPGPKDLLTVPAVALFVDRAQARNPRFQLSHETGPAVASICVRLDGLPLAIELVAASVKTLAPQKILSWIQERREIPSQIGADFPKRHHSLTEAIRVSYDLLTADEQSLFRRIGIFVGGFDLESLDAVCAGDGLTPDHAIRLLTHLIDKSLVQPDSDGARYRLLETIRGYALDKLNASGQTVAVSQRHTQYFLELAERDWKLRRRYGEGALFDRFQLDVDNFRATFARALAERDVMVGFRLGAALSGFLIARGFWSECQNLLERFVALAEDTGDLDRLPVARLALAWMSIPHAVSPIASIDRLARYLRIAREMGDHQPAAMALLQLGNLHLDAMDLVRARPLIVEAVAEARLCSYRPLEVDAVMSLGLLRYLEHDERTAAQLIHESLATARELGDTDGVWIALIYEGQLAFAKAAYEAAYEKWAEALRLCRMSDWRFPIPALLEGFAKLAMIQNNPDIALRLAGAADAARDVSQAPILAFLHADFDDLIDPLADGDAKRHPDWIAGHDMPAAQAVELALAVGSAPT